jgi:flagellar biogenesis protein FliO
VEPFDGIAAVVLVLSLLGVVVWKFGRIGNPGRLLRLAHRNAARLRSEDRIRLTPQHSVHLVTVDARTWLVGCHGNGMVLLAEVSPTEESKEPVRRSA